jgi:hypothetical protein
MLETLISDAKELALHEGTIRELARASGQSAERIGELYERELARLRPTARLKEFLPLLTRRAVIDSLSSRSQS